MGRRKSKGGGEGGGRVRDEGRKGREAEGGGRARESEWKGGGGGGGGEKCEKERREGRWREVRMYAMPLNSVGHSNWHSFDLLQHFISVGP